jgi:ketosteroid isomerase-like protein
VNPLSSENADLVQATIGAYFSGDESALYRAAHSDIVVTTRPDQPDARDHHGTAGLIEFLGEWAEAWEEYSFEVLRVWDEQDRVYLTARQGGHGKRSGIPIDDEVTFVFSMREGRIARLQMFATEREALSSAGSTRGSDATTEDVPRSREGS